MEAAEKLYWSKVFLAVVVAMLSTLLQSMLQFSGVTAFTFGLLLYLIFSDLLSRTFKIEKQRALKIGVGAYFFTWLTVWIIIFTVLNVSP